jgi:MoaA/NifB/PqqE/SkfB family radical SAM enzyme
VTFIAPKTKVLKHLDRIADWNRGIKAAPVTVEIDLSNRCPLGCFCCHFSHTHTRGPWTTKARLLPMAYESGGDLADVRMVTRALREMAEAGVKSIVWSGGGEPTTHPYVDDVVDMASRLGLEQGMYTLGGLFTEDSARYLAERLTWVVVSLDCKDGDTYAKEKGVPAERFEAACNGIRWLSGHKATVGVSFLLHANNWMHAQDMLRLARSLGATYSTFRPTINTDPNAPGVCTDDRRWVTAAFSTLERLSWVVDVEIDPRRFRQYQEWRGHGYDSCEGIRLNATVTPDGRVWLCPQRRGIAGSCIGDLSTESFADIWARHPGHYAVDDGCRVMCRLHPVNEQLRDLAQPVAHGAFI